MLPLPTNARSFFVAMLRWEGVDEEEIADSIESLAAMDDDAQYLMVQGGTAGIAQLDEGDSSITVSFGECDDVLKIYEIARDVYNFTNEARSLLC
jgi:hypothetical protein